MVLICRQGLWVLVASLLTLGLGGCTFDEDELHGLPEAGVEVAADAVDAAAGGRPDSAGLEIGTYDAWRIDAGRIDASADIPMPSYVDGGYLDVQRSDAAADAALGGLEVGIDAPAIGTSPIDATAVDATAVDGSRAEAARRDRAGSAG